MSELKPSHHYNKDELYRMVTILLRDGENSKDALIACRWIMFIELFVIIILGFWL